VLSIIIYKELNLILAKKRNQILKSGTRSIPVELEILEGNKFITSEFIGNKLEFNSLTLCIEFLHSKGLFIKRETLSKYIKLRKVFHNFSCKYLEKSLPIDFEKVGLIIEEYKKKKISLESVKRINKKINL
jgi:hypothetical protein